MGSLHPEMRPRGGRFSTRQLCGLLFLALGVLFFSSGCAPAPSLELLELHSVGPDALESGSELQVRGRGFPEGQTGTLFLTGTAYAPSQSARAVRWEFPIEAASRTSAAMRLDERLLSRNLGGADHVSFVGDVQLEFEPVIQGRPRLRGTFRRAQLDLFSKTKKERPGPHPSEFSQHLGLQLSPQLRVLGVAPQSPAESAGLEPGDQLHRLDQVRLHSGADFLPRPRGATSVIEYSRSGFAGFAEAHVDRRAFSTFDVVATKQSLAVLFAVVLSLVLVARAPKFVLLLARPSPASQQPLLLLPQTGPRAQAATTALFVGAVVAFHFRLRGLGATPDILPVLSGGGLLLLFSSFLLGGARRGGGRFSLLGAMLAGLERSLLLLPVAIASLYRISDVGSLRLWELARAQGMRPDTWGLVESPAHLLFALAYLAALLPLAGRRPPLAGEQGAPSFWALFSRLCEWSGTLLFLGLAIVLFLGDVGDAVASPVLSALFFSAKLAGLTALLSWLRLRSGQLRQNESWPLIGRATWLVSLVATALLAGQKLAGSGLVSPTSLGAFSLALLGASGLLVAVAARRSWVHPGRLVDPWF